MSTSHYRFVVATVASALAFTLVGGWESSGQTHEAVPGMRTASSAGGPTSEIQQAEAGSSGPDKIGRNALESQASAQPYARGRESEVTQLLFEQLGIEAHREAVWAYLVENHPGVASREAHRRLQQSYLLLAEALSQVMDGADPRQVFYTSGQQAAGVDPATWSFYVEHAANGALLEDLRSKAAQSYEDYSTEVAHGLSSLYEEAQISQRICELPGTRSAIEEYFEGLYPPQVEPPPLVAGEWEEQCRRHARAWILEFAREHFGVGSPDAEGWERHLSLLRDWDETLFPIPGGAE